MPGRPFLQIPGPTLVPERIVRAMSQPIIDHRGPQFAALVRECLDGLKGVFQTRKAQKVFRIGHLGSLNELELLGGLAGVELTLKSFGVSLPLGAGLAAAEQYLLDTARAE